MKKNVLRCSKIGIFAFVSFGHRQKSGFYSFSFVISNVEKSISDYS
ncbi:hypothetical protein [Pontibacter populi]|nr:hypothetical protein [Pontibacter populi]